MQDFEKLGAFYLGRRFDPATGQATDETLLYDAADLTTHAVCLGMTGSGKTGLGVALIEEAAIDGIPSIVIDPKGDLGNLLLTFPALSPGDFRPWVDDGEAARKGRTPDQYADDMAALWRKGLGAWGQEPDRIARLRAAADFAIYTPGSNAGRPLAILRSFSPPPAAVVADGSALRDRVQTAASGLLGLVGIAADPLQSREHILVSAILERAWREGRGVDLAGLIGEVQKPPFERIGVFDLESFFPAKDRFGLAMALNNLLASPGFSAWMEGDPLDVQRLLFTEAGKPRVAVISIAHLSDAERMFFVTLLLNEVVSWMRAQPGTSSLRALLYMDEIFGYFPPTAMPPSKLPMLTLLKQARAFGLGVVLATQNPVDLDYKGLANAGTWFIGRLQTERDKMRVLEGLASAQAGGDFDRAGLESMLSGLGQRVFLMRNVHEDRPVLFQTRWTLAYLRGPLTLPQIRQLAGAPAAAAPATVRPPMTPEPAPAPAPAPAPTAAAPRVQVPPGIREVFLRPAAPAAAGELHYRPAALAQARMHFVDAKAGVDTWVAATLSAPLADDGLEVLWAEAARLNESAPLDAAPAPNAAFAPLAAPALRPASYAAWQKTLADHLYQNETLEILRSPDTKLSSQPGETEGDFRTRIALALRERRDAAVEDLRRKYAPRLATLQDQIRRAQDRVEREKAQYGQQKLQTAISFGATLLGAFLGRKTLSVGNVGRAASTMRTAGRIGREHEDVGRAEEGLGVTQQKLEALQAEFEQESARVQGMFDAAAAPLERIALHPRKSDISVGTVALAWTPWRTGADGMTSPA